MTATYHAVRTPLVLPVAGAVTIGLFLMMKGLIDIGPVVPEPVEELPPVQIRFDVVDVEPDPGIDITEIPPVEAPPPAPRLDTPRSEIDAVPSDINWTLPPVEPVEVNTGRGLVNIDRQPSPRVRVEPVFPASEATRGRAGECTVVYDITPEGRTANIRPQSCTSQAFERATINAVSRWRYDPQIRNGEPVMFRGATTQLVYSLDG